SQAGPRWSSARSEWRTGADATLARSAFRRQRRRSSHIHCRAFGAAGSRVGCLLAAGLACGAGQSDRGVEVRVMIEVNFSLQKMGKLANAIAVVVVTTLALNCTVVQAADPARPFAIREEGGSAWLVRPNGERFFSFGVCCVDRGASRGDFNHDTPRYAR